MTNHKYLDAVRKENPLIHNMTNQVVANDVANALIAVGASPIMAYAKEEVEDVVSAAKALVLNIGTITEETAESMKVAGKKANEIGIPVVLDPVGVGATAFRQTIIEEFFEAINFTLIRGNSAEIATLAGIEWGVKGVDAEEGDASRTDIANKLANDKECIVAISGEDDIISDGKQAIKIKNGHRLLSQITGSGCMLSSLSGAYIGSQPDSLIESVVQAHIHFALAGERAAQSKEVKGPGSFKAGLHDALAYLTEEDLEKDAKIERTHK